MNPLILLSLSVLIILTACQSDLNTVDSTEPGKEMAINKHISVEKQALAICPDHSEPTIELIQTADDWIALQNYAAARRMKTIDKNDLTPAFDMESRLGVLVSLGRKPTPGYALQLVNSVIPVENSIAQISLHSSGPAPGSIMAQMITHPCLLVTIERNNYKAIHVTIDGSDRIKLEEKILR